MIEARFEDADPSNFTVTYVTTPKKRLIKKKKKKVKEEMYGGYAEPEMVPLVDKPHSKLILNHSITNTSELSKENELLVPQTVRVPRLKFPIDTTAINLSGFLQN